MMYKDDIFFHEQDFFDPKTVLKIPDSERPRERCLTQGAHSLSFRECLALLIQSGPPGIGCLGLASQLLNRPGQGLTEHEQERAFFVCLENSETGHLQSLRGLGPAAQARILAALEIGRRFSIHQLRNSLQSTSSASSRYKNLPQLALDKIEHSLRITPREWLGFVPIYGGREVGDFTLVEKGVRTHVNFDPAELFARILSLRPRGFYLFHNHPGGSLEPSHSDLLLTTQVIEASKLLGIRLFGHGIITPSHQTWVPIRVER